MFSEDLLNSAIFKNMHKKKYKNMHLKNRWTCTKNIIYKKKYKLLLNDNVKLKFKH
jgi:hypothetical protein